jgi:glucokinase
VLSHAKRPTGRDTTVETLTASLAELLAELGGASRPERIGVGIAGVIGRDGVLRGGPNLPALIGRSIAAELSAGLGTTVIVENDANCAALAEGWHGAADGVEHYLVVTLGTGLGSGVVLDGRLYRGATGYACELGHSIVAAGGRECGCGNRGCLEAYVSEAAVRSVLAERGDALNDAVRVRADRNAEGLSQALFEIAAGDGEGLERAGEARAIVLEMIEMLGVGLASAVNVLDLETIVLTGGIAPAVLARLEPLRAAMARALFARAAERVAVLAGMHGQAAGAIGAARLAFDPL